MLAAAALARVGAFAPSSLRAAPLLTPLRAKYTAADGTPIKAALSAYMFFCNDARVRVTAEEKEKAGAAFKQTLVMTKLGALWRELPDAEKVGYQNQAKEDKVRYDAALKSIGVLTKAEKKANGPKRPLSAYMHFCAERRPSLTDELKASLGAGFKYTLVMTKLGEEWKAVGDKSKYEALAAADKAAKSA